MICIYLIVRQVDVIAVEKRMKWQKTTTCAALTMAVFCASFACAQAMSLNVQEMKQRQAKIIHHDANELGTENNSCSASGEQSNGMSLNREHFIPINRTKATINPSLLQQKGALPIPDDAVERKVEKGIESDDPLLQLYGSDAVSADHPFLQPDE